SITYHEPVRLSDIGGGVPSMGIDDNSGRRDAKPGHQKFFHFDRFAIWAAERVTVSSAYDDERRPAFFKAHRGNGAMHFIIGTYRCRRELGTITGDHDSGKLVFGPV